MIRQTGSKSLIAQCVKKSGKLELRPLFGSDNFPLYHEYKGIIGEGDIIFFNCSNSGNEPEYRIYKKDTIFNRYILQFERAGINPLFSDEIIKEVGLIINDPGIDDPLLIDYTSLPFVTIDNDGSKDLDQAVYVEKKNSGYIIYYAIADASCYVKPGSALFRESIRRGASYYLPGFSVPMLPPELSEGIISLNEGVQRRALVFEMSIDHEGELVSRGVKRCRISSRAKLSYTGVQEFYDCAERSPLNNKEYTGSLILLQEAGRVLVRNGERRGVINFERYETSISINNDGKSFVFSETERNDAARWNEQVSLICNMAGAGMVAPEGNGNDVHVQPVFRVHEAPDQSSLNRLELVINTIVKIHSLDECWKWKKGSETTGEYLARLPRSGSENRITRAIERQILVTNQKSFFSENPGRHFALKVNLYGRFSSPMREIVGIYSHKELLEKIGLEKPGPDQEDLLIREQVINSANRAKETQSSIDRFVNALLLESVFTEELNLEFDKRPVHTGTILGMKESRLYVLLDSPLLEIKVYSGDLEKVSGYRPECHDNMMILNPGSDDSVIFKAGEFIRLKLLSFDESGKWHMIPADISCLI